MRTSTSPPSPSPLAGPMHIRIILLLRGAERSSGELAELTGRSPAAVS